jgi:hypothetical protein
MPLGDDGMSYSDYVERSQSSWGRRWSSSGGLQGIWTPRWWFE